VRKGQRIRDWGGGNHRKGCCPAGKRGVLLEEKTANEREREALGKNASITDEKACEDVTALTRAQQPKIGDNKTVGNSNKTFLRRKGKEQSLLPKIKS